MSLTNLNRDIKFLNFTRTDIATNETQWGSNLIPRSDGVVYDSYAALNFQSTVTIATALRNRSVCVHIEGSDNNGLMSLYRVKARCFARSGQLVPFFFVAMSPASPSSSAGGDTVTDDMRFGDYDHNPAYLDEVLAIPAMPTADRALAFGIGFFGISAGSYEACGQLSVQRLSVAPPALSKAVS